MHRHAELAGYCDRLLAVALGLVAACPRGRSRANTSESRMRRGIIELCCKPVERRSKSMARDRSQDHPTNIGAARPPVAP
jgi:hypothetical protein